MESILGDMAAKEMNDFAAEEFGLDLYQNNPDSLPGSQEELDHLFSLFKKIPSSLGDFSKNNVRFNTIGNLALIPSDVKEALEDLMKKTEHHTGLVFTLAIAYGGRDEIIRSVQKIIKSGISSEEINEQKFENFLDTANMPEVDLVIRTGGYQRLSGYLPWQSTYAELYFTSLKFPDFNEKELDKAIQWFNEQERKRGK